MTNYEELMSLFDKRIGTLTEEEKRRESELVAIITKEKEEQIRDIRVRVW